MSDKKTPKPSLNALRCHAQMTAMCAALGIKPTTAVVIDADGVRASLNVGDGV